MSPSLVSRHERTVAKKLTLTIEPLFSNVVIKFKMHTKSKNRRLYLKTLPHKRKFLAQLPFFCLHGPFNCISFHKFSRQLSVLSLCSSGLISALLVLSTVFHSINSPANFLFSHSVLPVLSPPCWSFQLYFIPYILPPTLCSLTLFFRSYLRLTGSFNCIPPYGSLLRYGYNLYCLTGLQKQQQQQQLTN